MRIVGTLTKFFSVFTLIDLQIGKQKVGTSKLLSHFLYCFRFILPILITVSLACYIESFRQHACLLYDTRFNHKYMR